MSHAVYLILFVFSLGISLLVTARAVRLAERWGFIDSPGERKVHDRPKPRLGGLGVCAGFFLTLFAALLAAYFAPLALLPDSPASFLVHHRRGLEKEWLALLGLVAGGAVIFAGGLLDDKRSLSPKGKLLWEISAAGIAIAAGFRLEFHQVLFKGVGLDLLISVPVTLLWMLFLINAFNLLDNMDGLSAGVAAITTAFFAIYAHWQGEFFLAAAMTCLIGALLGFLRFNWNPSRIFMGDGGALLVGFLIAAFTCRCTYYRMSMTPGSILSLLLAGETLETRQGLLSLLTPLVIMAVPIFDTASVVFIRWRSGKPLMQGDKNHFSHRLVALGLSQPQAVIVIYLATIFTGLGALVLQSASITQAILVFLQVLSVFAMILLLERPGHARRGEGK